MWAGYRVWRMAMLLSCRRYPVQCRALPRWLGCRRSRSGPSDRGFSRRRLGVGRYNDRFQGLDPFGGDENGDRQAPDRQYLKGTPTCRVAFGHWDAPVRSQFSIDLDRRAWRRAIEQSTQQSPFTRARYDDSDRQARAIHPNLPASNSAALSKNCGARPNGGDPRGLRRRGGQPGCGKGD
jgi:hypothetical protein